MNTPAKQSSKEMVAMAAVILIVVVVGGIFLWNQSEETEGSRKVNHNAKRYSEGSLHYVDESLIKYKRTSQFPTGFKRAWSLYPAEDGKVYVSGDSGIRVFDGKGSQLNEIKTSAEVRHVTQGPEKKIYACVKNRIEVFDAKGNPSTVFKNKKWGELNAIAFSKEHLYVADKSNRTVWKCDLEGNVLLGMGSHLEDKKNGLVIPGDHMDLVWGKDDLLYVTNPGRHNINAYAASGNLQSVFGKPSFKHTGFCGCCNPVAMTLLDNNQVITSEKGIARVKLLNKDGEFKGIVAPPIDFKANKHAFIVDVVASASGAIFLLENGTNEVYIYNKKEA